MEQLTHILVSVSWYVATGINLCTLFENTSVSEKYYISGMLLTTTKYMEFFAKSLSTSLAVIC